jgi:molybdopterin-biosynthesis enzyme MoeA-like protein
MTDTDDIAAYVAAAARAQGLTLSEEALGRVTTTFARNAAIARVLLEADLPEAVEPAPVFKP